MQEINYTSEVNIRVRYAETDQMGYCYYGNYAQYFEVGRVEALRDLGVNYRTLEEEGYMLPVVSYSVKYHRPAFYDDLLKIVTKIISLRGVRLEFEYEVYNASEELLSEATTVLVFVDKETMRPTIPPKMIKELFAT